VPAVEGVRVVVGPWARCACPPKLHGWVTRVRAGAAYGAPGAAPHVPPSVPGGREGGGGGGECQGWRASCMAQDGAMRGPPPPPPATGSQAPRRSCPHRPPPPRGWERGWAGGCWAYSWPRAVGRHAPAWGEGGRHGATLGTPAPPPPSCPWELRQARCPVPHPARPCPGRWGEGVRVGWWWWWWVVGVVCVPCLMHGQGGGGGGGGGSGHSPPPTSQIYGDAFLCPG
jgi:hypothetical protein